MFHPGRHGKRKRRAKALCLCFALSALVLTSLSFSSPSQPQSGKHAQVPKAPKILDDFEGASSLASWRGKVELSRTHSGHGRQSLKASLSPQDVSSDLLPKDWRGYDRLLFDIFNPEVAPVYLGVRIYDQLADDDVAEARGEAFLADRKLLLIPGMNHVEVKLDGLETSSSRQLALDRVRRFAISAKGLERPLTIYIDNLRLVNGVESGATASLLKPADGIATLDSRFVRLGQVGPRDLIPESQAVQQKREHARAEWRRLQESIEAARTMGIETIYQEIPLITAELGVELRPLLSWFNDDRTKSEMFDYVSASCRAARGELEELITGAKMLPDVDDTQVGEPLVPPYPSLKGRPAKDGYFRKDNGDPLLVLSLHSPSQKLARFFATPFQHIESYTAGGGSRWTVDDSPVYEAFNDNPDAKRVGWDGWCGHLIRDRWSMGGGRDEVVICLESPQIRKAIEKYIEHEAPRWLNNPELLYNVMGYELQYICYCERSQQMFRKWLAERHTTVEGLNAAWKTDFKSFAEIFAPPAKDSAPLAGANRAQWFDWATFNQERFTDHLAWVKSVIRRFDPVTPITAGGSHSMLAGSNATSGIDEELMVNRFSDLVLHEGGGSTLGADLHWALTERRLPLADPEMSVSVRNLLPHFLHGKSVIQLFYWPSQPAVEHPRLNESSIAHSHRWSLRDIGELLRIALDVRKLNKEIAALAAAPREVAVLYSRTSLVQVSGKLMRAASTPYLDELRSTYEASLYLDAGTTFITERQLLAGLARQYKAILVPAAKYAPPEVAQALLDYLRQGGQLIVSPDSLLADQYLRPLNFFAQAGVEIVKTRAGNETELGALEQGYDQTLRRAAVKTGTVEGEIITMPGTEPGGTPIQLRGRGIIQQIKAGANIGVLARSRGGEPAIIGCKVGSGSLTLLATQLEPESYAQLLDLLFERAGVTRQIRVTDVAGQRLWQVEARSLQYGRSWLLYLINHRDSAIEVKLSLPPATRSVLDLRRDRELAAGNPIPLAAGETRILRIE
jgi:beta-galactosidase GanA